MTDFYSLEDATGTRFSWNTIPVTRGEAENCTIPLGALYSPFTAEVQRSDVAPIECKGCRFIINEHCTLDLAANVWTCCGCGMRNSGRVTTLPTGASQHYIVGSDPTPTLLVFVIDLHMAPEELTVLKEQILTTIKTLSHTNTFASFVLFDSEVKVCDPSNILMDRRIILHGSESYSTSKIAETLNVKDFKNRPYNQHTVTHYFSPLYDPSSVSRIEHIIEGITPTVSVQKHRALRSTGLAIQTATVLASETYKTQRSHIFLFTTGPPTLGQGAVVGKDKSESIRSYSDIRRGKAKLSYGTKNFYDDIAKECIQDGSSRSISLFISGYDQVGLYEMRSLSEKTGGVSLLVDSFSMNIFKRSFERLFELDTDGVLVHLNTSANVTVKTSKYLEVAGFIGPGTTKKGNDESVSDHPIGYGLGNKVQLGLLAPFHTFGVYFRSRTVAYGSRRRSMPHYMYAQFQTRYTASNGVCHLKVVTVKKSTTNEEKMDQSFDQEATTVLLARKIIFDITHDKMDHEKISSTLEKTLRKLLRNFAIYIPDEPNTFTLHQNFQLIPQFFYNLIKSPMMMNFNTTPDESTYYTSIFTRSDTPDSLLMIQPHLTAYKPGIEPYPVLLDTASLDPSAVLLMDSFFHVVIHIGMNLAIQRDSGSSIEDTLEPAIAEAADLCSTRFPLPRYVVADEGSSQARFLKSRLNPSENDGSASGGDEHKAVHTEDVTVGQFYKRIVASVVKK
ncbi:CYFA0S07e01728g1_1 [Cyberlindnera fabianii]|uniref:Protein transport protein SEC23 n=1 Tax=Cyberlindnera fabianii TaxID=36022 RepID=A0A061AW44_CYBFA|nr:CYFA0S07e01728g1_1 [Cyberlindnera fabianii]